MILKDEEQKYKPPKILFSEPTNPRSMKENLLSLFTGVNK